MGGGGGEGSYSNSALCTLVLFEFQILPLFSLLSAGMKQCFLFYRVRKTVKLVKRLADTPRTEEQLLDILKIFTSQHVLKTVREWSL